MFSLFPLVIFLVFLFGTIIGSFLNVVIYRFNTGLSIAAGRSQCFSCGHALEWYELVPLFSFLIQGGKCRSCKSRISWQYPLVEFATGLLFVGIVLAYPPLTASYLALDVFYAVIWSILVVIVVYDFRHKIIPDSLGYTFAGLSFIKLFIVITPLGFAFHAPSLLDLLAGPILFLPFFILWYVSGGRWMGLGDGKLALGIGWFLGIALGTSAIVIGFWSGALIGIALILLQRFGRKSVFHRMALFLGIGERIMKSEIPFAPFLIFGVLLVFLFHIDVTGLSAFL
jgi:leader peptidase (prepilin peptidase)/N-methyltransferase